MTNPYSHFAHALQVGAPEKGFNIWAYGTREPLEKVLKPRYFQSNWKILRDGDLLVISTPTKRKPARPADPGYKVVALLERVGVGDPEVARAVAARQTGTKADAGTPAETKADGGAKADGRAKAEPDEGPPSDPPAPPPRRDTLRIKGT